MRVQGRHASAMGPFAAARPTPPHLPPLALADALLVLLPQRNDLVRARASLLYLLPRLGLLLLRRHRPAASGTAAGRAWREDLAASERTRSSLMRLARSAASRSTTLREDTACRNCPLYS